MHELVLVSSVTNNNVSDSRNMIKDTSSEQVPQICRTSVQHLFSKKFPQLLTYSFKRHMATRRPSFIVRVHFNRDIMISIFGLVTAFLALYRLHKPISGIAVRDAAGSGKV
jgi:hypothetical protein